MATITDIKPQQRNKNRVNIYIDGEYSFAIEQLSAVKFGLKIGVTVDSETLANSVFDSECSSAFGKAVDYLSRSMRTAKQMKTYLGGKGYSQQVVDNTICKLQQYNYINDTIYATMYIANSQATKGTRRIKQELSVKGIDKQIIDQVCIIDSDSQLQSACHVAQKYMKNKHSDINTLVKLNRHLLSRGYDYDTVSAVVSTYKGEDN